VPRARYGEAVDIITESMSNIGYGDPNDPANLQGPQVSKRQQERVLAYIKKGQSEGAKLVVGGGVPKHLPKGFFVEPTLFIDVDNKMTIAQEEIFGPVLAVIPYEDDDDAVRIANDSIYGLSGMISSGDVERAKAVASRIRTGTLCINGGVFYGADTPFGGYKQSGVGRQCGIEGLEIFTQTKSIALPV
jgi:aldehyde dehydrogenase (NAD+)